MSGRGVALVTGATGFVGPHLCRLLRASGFGVATLARGEGADYRIDVLDRNRLIGAFREARPRWVYHLAAFALAAGADAQAALVQQVNCVGTANVLDGAAEVGARTLFVSSAMVYGARTRGEGAADEECELRPRGAYACSKAAAEELCRERAGRQEIVVVRPFNHTGPGQSPRYVCSDFARQVALCERGAREPTIEVGDLRAERDFSDVRDVARAYVSALVDGRPGSAYNVCSGRAVAVREILDRLLALSHVEIRVRVAPERLREGEPDRLVGSYARLERDTGWRPEIPLEKTLGDVLEYWREHT